MIFSQKGLKCSINWSYRGFLLFSLVIFISCNKDNGSNLESGTIRDFEVKDSLVLKLDETTTLDSYYLQLLDDGRIAYLNRIKNNIVFFDATGSISGKIDIPNVRDLNSSQLSGFYYVNEDSIVVEDGYNYISFYNEDARITNKYLFTNLDKLKSVKEASIINLTKSPFFKRNNNLYFNTINYGSFEHQLMSFMNLGNGEVDYLDIYYPDSYDEGYWNHPIYLDLSYAYNPSKDIIVFSYGNNKNLFVYDFATNLMNEIDVPKSNFITIEGPIFNYKPTPADREAYEEKVDASSYYHSIYYDQYKDLYYRFTASGVVNAENLKPNEPKIRKYSLCVIDNQFNVLAEYPLPVDKYNLQLVFVNEEGLHIKREHSSEDEIVFDVFSFK